MTIKIIEPQGVVDYNPADVKGEVLVEPKMDGWRCLISWTDGVPELFTRNGEEIKLPHLQREAAMILPRGMFMDGELTHPEGFEAIKGAIALKDEDLEFHAFDLVRESFFETGVDKRSYIRRRCDLVEIFGSAETNIHHVGIMFADPCDVEVCHLKYLELGFEGSVVKLKHSLYREGKTGDWMRIKPVDTADCVVIGVMRSETDPTRARSIIVRNGDGIVTNVHAGLTEDFLRNAMEHPGRLVDQVMEIAYRGTYLSGKMRHASFVRMRPDKTMSAQGVLA